MVTKKQILVVPYIGTWIETPLTDCQNCFGTVVPYIGTWIETPQPQGHIECTNGRTLYRYVD